MYAAQYHPCCSSLTVQVDLLSDVAPARVFQLWVKQGLPAVVLFAGHGLSPGYADRKRYRKWQDNAEQRLAQCHGAASCLKQSLVAAVGLTEVPAPAVSESDRGAEHHNVVSTKNLSVAPSLA